MRTLPKRVTSEMNAPTPAAEELCADLERLHSQSFAWSLICCRGDRSEAEDVLQTTYLKILDGRARFAGEGRFKTWLFAVIRRTAAGRRRRTALRERLLSLMHLGSRSPSPIDPEKAARGSEQERRLRRQLAVLSLRQRQVLELVFYHDLTIEQAAGVLGLALGTARIHYERGKKRFAETLLKEEENELAVEAR